MSEEDDKFDEIIEGSGLAEVFDEMFPSVLTLGDLYEGLALMSNVQVDVHDYLKSVIRTIQYNHRSSSDWTRSEIPQMSVGQATALSNIFKWTALFLEDPGV